MKKGTAGSAFIVKNIKYAPAHEEIQVEWFYSGQSRWQKDRSSTRGEHLIRRDSSGKPLREFRAVLELQSPYLAEVGETEIEDRDQ